MSHFISTLIRFALITLISAGCAPQTQSAPTAFNALTPTKPIETGTPALPTAIPLPTFTPNPVLEADGLLVDRTIELGPINPYVFGTNYGPWIALPANMIPDAKVAGMTMIRFPGGAWGDTNDLKGYQIDQFIAFSQMLGSTPSISVRLHNGTPQQAAALVQYTNIDKRYGVKYWSIGNEPTLYTNEGKGIYDTPQYNQEWRAIAKAMEAVDPGIILIGPEVHQFTANPAKNPKDSAGRDWMTEFLKSNGDMVDIVSFHRYPFPKNMTESTNINDLRQNASEWTEIIRYLRGLIRETTGRDIPVSVTEFSTHYNKAVGGDATPDSHYAAIWLGDLLGRFITEDIQIANHWMLTSGGGQGGWGIIGRGELRPTYYTYQMYKMFGNQRVFSSSSKPDTQIYAAINKDGALTVMIVNLMDEAVDIPLTIKGTIAPVMAQVWLFDKDHKAEKQPDKTLSSEEKVTLNGQSITLFIIK